MRWSALLFVLAACGDGERDITVVTPPAWSFALGELVTLTPHDGLRVETQAVPAAHSHSGFEIVVMDDPAMALEAYEVDRDTDPSVLIVRAHDVLGAQYGVGRRARGPRVPVPPSRTTRSYRPSAGRRSRSLGVVHAARGPRPRAPAPHAASDRGLLRVLGAVGRHDGRRASHHRLARSRTAATILQWVALDDILDAGSPRDVAGVHARADRLRARARHPRRPQHPAVRPERTCSSRSISRTTTPAPCRSPTRSRARLPLVTDGPAVRRLRPQLRRVLRRRPAEVHRRDRTRSHTQLRAARARRPRCTRSSTSAPTSA